VPLPYPVCSRGAARGAAGNVATEDVVYLLDGFGIAHGVDLDGLLDASAFISAALRRASGSHVAQALLAARRRDAAAGAAPP